MTPVVFIEIILCIVLFFVRNRLGFLGYQLGIAFVYLLALCFEQTLDYTMSVYFFFAAVPYIRYFRIPNALGMIFALYLLGHSVASTILNGPVQVLSMLVIHYLGPLLLIYLFSNIPRAEMIPERFRSPSKIHQYVDRILLFAVFAETVVSALATALSPDGRLMLNYQCVSGCIACCCVVLIYHQISGDHRKVFSAACMAIFLLWSFVSGTRGYIVLAFGMAFFVIACQRDKSIPVLISCLLMIAVCVVVIMTPDTIAGIVEDSRFGESTGRRAWENQWAVNLFLNQGLLKDVFGFGLATQYSTQPGTLAAFAGIQLDAYSFEMIYNGDTLHNFWYSCILSIGLFGCILFIALFVEFAKKVSLRIRDRHLATLVIAFIAIYAFVIWFRWTATGGILEAAVIYSLIKLSADTEGQKHVEPKLKVGEHDI